jgi:hypothetical protein
MRAKMSLGKTQCFSAKSTVPSGTSMPSRAAKAAAQSLATNAGIWAWRRSKDAVRMKTLPSFAEHIFAPPASHTTSSKHRTHIRVQDLQLVAHCGQFPPVPLAAVLASPPLGTFSRPPNVVQGGVLVDVVDSTCNLRLVLQQPQQLAIVNPSRFVRGDEGSALKANQVSDAVPPGIQGFCGHGRWAFSNLHRFKPWPLVIACSSDLASPSSTL